MKLTAGLMAKMRNSAGYREHSILDNLKRYEYRPENGYRVIRFFDNNGKSCEYSLKLERWTN